MSIEQTIALLMTDNNERRKQAEDALNTLAETQPEQFVFECLRLMAESGDQAVRTMCCILYRRTAFNKLVDSKSAWNRLTAPARAEVKERLLRALTREPLEHVRKTISDTVSDTATYLHNHKQTWQELPGHLFQLCQSPEEGNRVAALEIFAEMPTMFDEQARQRYLGVLKDIFVKALTDAGSLKVNVAGLKAIVGFLVNITQAERQQMSDIVPHMIEVLRKAVVQNESLTQTVLALLIDVADRVPAFFRLHLEVICPLMVELVMQRQQRSLENATAQLALEFVIVLAETKAEMIQAYAGYMPLVLPACLSLMVDVEEDPTWFTVEELQDIEMEANDTVGEQGVDRLSAALGGEIMLPVALPHIVQLLSHAQWQYRHAGLLALGALAEGSKEQLEAQLPNIVPEIIKYANDPYPRVRHALCNCLGQMCLDFRPDFQESFAPIVVPTLIAMTEDGSQPRIQSHAAAALVNFVDDTPRRVMEPYLNVLLAKLLHMLQTVNKRYAIEQVIDTVATVAETAGDLFANYYATFVPLLKSILMQPITPDSRLLRAKAMECVTLIGIAVGKDMFMQDAKETMEILLNAHGRAPLSSDDPQASYLLSAYGRIGATLKEDFVPYLQHVMPALMHSADLKPELTMLDEDEDETDYPSNEWEIIELDDKRVGIKTSTLEEKLTAIEMLFCFAREIGPGFATYAVDVLKLTRPLLKFYWDENIRIVAAGIISPLFDCLKMAHADGNFIVSTWHEVVAEFYDVMDKETVPDMLMRLLEGFRGAVRTMDANCLTDAEIDRFIEIFVKQFTNSVKRTTKRNKKRLDKRHTDDADEMDDADELEAMMLRELSDTVHDVYKTQSSRFTVRFQRVAPDMSTFMHPQDGRTASQRVVAMCIFIDTLEFDAANVGPFLPLFLDKVLAAVVDPDTMVRQVACYGVGTLAQFGGPSFAPMCAAALQSLLAVIKQPTARDEENVNATENAISAVGKICQYNNTAFDVNSVLPLWLAALPVVEDAQEATSTYNFLCSLIESNNPVILGQDNRNLPKIVQALALAVSSDVLEDDLVTKTRVLRILREIHNQVPVEMRAKLWELVDESSQHIVQPQIQ